MSGGGPHVEDASQDATRTGLMTKKVKEKGKERKERREGKVRKKEEEVKGKERRKRRRKKKKGEERKMDEHGRTAVLPGRWFPDPPSRLVPNLQVRQSPW